MHSYDMMPYEVVKEYGAEELDDKELLAVFIRTGTRKQNAVEVADRVLNSFPERNLLGLCHIPWKELMKIPGIGEVKAIKLKCLAELARRISRMEARKGLKFDQPGTIWQYYKESLRHEEREKVILIMLDQKLQMLSDAVLSIGTVRESIVSPRELFLLALKEKAVQIMLVHNHPSGDPTPSRADLAITRRVQMLGAMMEIPLTDHIIIGDKTYCSLREKGYFTE
ncbi:DNA repair protein RadC [bacterium 1XD8-76]|nr:DNA repair protein RadC [bacterium 1XD8-76]